MYADIRNQADEVWHGLGGGCRTTAKLCQRRVEIPKFQGQPLLCPPRAVAQLCASVTEGSGGLTEVTSM